ncbi:hypothetical protein VTO73DRAFT_3558 [Trametes versicolor]
MPSSNPTISVHLARTFLMPGHSVEGEVELNFQELQQDNIQEVHVKLRGVVRTELTVNTTTDIKTVPLVRDDASVWSQGGAYPPPGSNTIRIPFRFLLPPDLPPSFHYSRYGRKGAVRYAVTAVGTRPSTFSLNRRVHAPLAIIPKDSPQGVALREKLALMAATGAECEWRKERKEEKMRRGLWGDYATAQVELQIPKVAACPLYVPIPFVIKIKTISAPLTRAKADAHPADQPVFPPVPASFSEVQFKLHEKLFIKATSLKEKVPADVVQFKPHAESDTVLAEDVPPRTWVALDSTDEKKSGEVDPHAKGTWVQEATFRSTFRLDCPPTFALNTLTCDYDLTLKVPFPGVGNDVSLSMPIVITSGIDVPVVRDQPDASGAPLDLPPSYWDAGDKDWDIDLKD